MVIDDLNNEVKAIRKIITLLTCLVYFSGIILLLMLTKLPEIAFTLAAFIGVLTCSISTLWMFRSTAKYKDLLIEGLILKSTVTRFGISAYLLSFLCVFILGFVTCNSSFSWLVFAGFSGVFIGLVLLIIGQLFW